MDKNKGLDGVYGGEIWRGSLLHAKKKVHVTFEVILNDDGFQVGTLEADGYGVYEFHPASWRDVFSGDEIASIHDLLYFLNDCQSDCVKKVTMEDVNVDKG